MDALGELLLTLTEALVGPLTRACERMAAFIRAVLRLRGRREKERGRIL